MTRSVTLLFAAVCGLSVANIYFAHPLLDAIAHDLGFRQGSIGLVVTVTQVGYALGLLFIVPLGDLLQPRRLIVTQASLSAVALVVVGVAVSPTAFLVAMFFVGLLAVVVQVLVVYAANLATQAERGRIVGTVTSGVVTGILLARFVSGALADIGGWRTVYFTSATLMLLMARALWHTLPLHPPRRTINSYAAVLHSTVELFLAEPLLRRRAVLALLIFAAFNVLWAPLVFPLTASPLSLSHTAVGLFGLVGVAGALGATQAGRWADRGFAQRTTGFALTLMMLAWAPIAELHSSLAALGVGVLMLDFAIQAVHVTSQSMLFDVRPEARSRLIAAYMSFYSVGSATGAIASTAIWVRAGWPGVCTLGATVSACALLFWLITRGSDCPRACASSIS